jgi:hypothetical protein
VLARVYGRMCVSVCACVRECVSACVCAAKVSVFACVLTVTRARACACVSLCEKHPLRWSRPGQPRRRTPTVAQNCDRQHAPEIVLRVHAGAMRKHAQNSDRQHAPEIGLRVHVGAVREERRRRRMPFLSSLMERRGPAAERARAAHSSARLSARGSVSVRAGVWEH